MCLINGLHHITAVAADPQRNLDFYTDVLGLRLVKKTVNQDDPFTYHLYYGDARGGPGSTLTFFPFPGVPAGQPGRGQPIETRLAVALMALGEWREHLMAAGIAVRASTTGDQLSALHFTDPDGLPLALVGQAAGADVERTIQGLAGMSLSSHRPEATARVLTDLLGYTPTHADASGQWFQGQGERTLDQLQLLNDVAPGQAGYGTVHHVAFRVADRPALLAMLEQVQAWQLPCSGEVDRYYFRSVYFREPGGMLFEIATDDPGFDVDEPVESLGSALKLAPAHEPMRATIEAHLPALVTRPL